LNSPFLPPYLHRFLPPLCYKNKVLQAFITSTVRATCCVVLAISNTSSIFQLYGHNILNTYILLPLTSCMFGRLLHHLQGEYRITCSKTICFFIMLLHRLCI
jgi:hypothetical protein